MTMRNRKFLIGGLLTLLAALGLQDMGLAQGFQEPGRSIGTISTRGDLILMKLREGVLAGPNLFDLARRTLRFTPEGPGYRAENLALNWDADFGSEVTEAQVTLRNFAFPYSGKSWNSFSGGMTGSISFGAAEGGGRGGRGGGVSIGRFDQLREAARTLINTVPAICVFLKPRLSGTRHIKELPDRVVITWNLTEPVGGIQDFTWVPTVNRFQAVLGQDGSIEMSYDQVAARDAIVGLYPMMTAGAERPLESISDEEDAAVAEHLDLRSVKIAAVDGLFLKITLETRGPLLPEGDLRSKIRGVLPGSRIAIAA